MEPWLAYFLGMITIPLLTVMYIGIAKAIEGQEEWRSQQYDASEENSLERLQSPSEKYWHSLTKNDPHD